MTDPSPRYRPALRRLHWLMATLVLCAYLAIEQRGLFARGSAGRAAVMQAHFWLGVAIFALATWRLALRRRLDVPPITPAPPAWSAWVGRVTHWALYAFFLVMPALGLCTIWTSGRRSLLLPGGLAVPSPLAGNHALSESLEHLHKTIGTAFYWVIGLHVAAALYHHLIRRDDTLRRML